MSWTKDRTQRPKVPLAWLKRASHVVPLVLQGHEQIIDLLHVLVGGHGRGQRGGLGELLGQERWHRGLGLALGLPGLAHGHQLLGQCCCTGGQQLPTVWGQRDMSVCCHRPGVPTAQHSTAQPTTSCASPWELLQPLHATPAPLTAGAHRHPQKGSTSHRTVGPERRQGKGQVCTAKCTLTNTVLDPTASKIFAFAQ